MVGFLLNKFDLHICNLSYDLKSPCTGILDGHTNNPYEGTR